MQLPLHQLAAHLQKQLRPLYLLHGDEPLLQQEAQDAIRAAARAQGYTERSSFTVAGAHFDWSAVLAAGSSLSLFAERQIIDLRIPSGKPGKEGAAALQQIAQAAPGNDALLTLISLPRLDKATRSSAWFTALEAAGVALQIDPVERGQLPGWIAQRLAAQGQSLPPGEAGQRTLQFFAERVEGNLLAAHQEIQKLALLYPPGELPEGAVQAAVLNVARYDVFKLSEAVLAGQALRAQRMLDGLQAEGTAAVLTHWVLAEDIRALKRCRDALDAGKPLPMVLRENRIWGAKEGLYGHILQQRGNAPLLARLLQSAHRVDGIVKGLKAPDWPQDAWQALGRLALQMSRLAPPAGRH